MSKQTKEREIRTLATKEFRVAAAEDGTRILSGLIPYNSMSCDLGGFTEMIAPGAFADALIPDADVLMLRDHKPELLMGRTKSGTLALTDSPEGLRFSCKLPKTSQATDLAESVDRGDLDATSFGFMMDEDKWAADDLGNVVRTLIDVDLFEISPCSFPAYPAAAVAIRSCPVEMRSIIDGKSEKRSGCQCQCPECVAGDCTQCSSPDCTEDTCSCEQRNKPIGADDLSTLQLKLTLASLL